MELVQLQDLPTDEQELVAAAVEASKRAYAPYSKFAVGAAARSRGGKIHPGANMENASYGVTICAEVGALARAVTDDDFEICKLAVVGMAIGSEHEPNRPVITPCGRCRQLIYEASLVSGEDFDVICCNSDLTQIARVKTSELLPLGFGPSAMRA